MYDYKKRRAPVLPRPAGSRLGGMLTREQVRNRNAETRQDFLIGQYLLHIELRDFSQRTVDQDPAKLGDEYPYRIDPPRKIVLELLGYISPTVIWREHFDGQLRSYIEIAAG